MRGLSATGGYALLFCGRRSQTHHAVFWPGESDNPNLGHRLRPRQGEYFKETLNQGSCAVSSDGRYFAAELLDEDERPTALALIDIGRGERMDLPLQGPKARADLFFSAEGNFLALVRREALCLR